MPYVNDPGDWSQVQEELAIEQMEMQQYACRCPQCNRFGLVQGWDDHYGTIYRCGCLVVFWVIDPVTGEKVEGS